MDGHKKEEEASKSKPFYFTYIYYSSDSELFVFFFQIRLPQAWSSSAASGQSSYYPQAIFLHSTCLQKNRYSVFFLHKTNLFQIFSTSYNRKNCLVDMIELFKIAFQPKIQYQKSNYLIILQLLAKELLRSFFLALWASQRQNCEKPWTSKSQLK